MTMTMKTALAALLPTIVSGSSWYGMTADRNRELQACASELLGTITFKPNNQWTTSTTGDEVCAQLNAGGCKKVVDWNCKVFSCSETSERSRITECDGEDRDLAATWTFSCAGKSVEKTCSESLAAVWVDSKGVACAAQRCANGAFWGRFHQSTFFAAVAKGRANNGVDASQACCSCMEAPSAACPAEQFRCSAHGEKCRDCPLGHAPAPENPGSGSCRPCPACLCAAGKYHDVILGCQDCAKGSYQVGRTILSECADCPNVHHTTQNSGATRSSDCTCVAGRYGNECSACAAGKYRKLVDNNDRCEECPSGKTSRHMALPSSASCKQCPSGKYMDRHEKCLACLTGQYASAPNMEACIHCEADKYADTTQSKDCKMCRAHVETSLVGDTSCHPVTCTGANEYLDVTDGNCRGCTQGKLVNAGKDGCDDCPGGKFLSSRTDPLKCIACAQGSFCMPGECRDQCKDCASEREGCPAGQQQNESCDATSGGGCVKCPQGKFKGQNENGIVANPTACQECPSGQHLGDEGGGSCKSCVEGRYQNTRGKPQCKQCPAGRYAPSSGSSECKSCTSGSDFAAGEGNSECLSCEPCPAGQVQVQPCTPESSTVCTSCAACPVGQHRTGCSGTSKGDCQECGCSTGYFLQAACTGSNPNICQLCEPGRYQPVNDNKDLECAECATVPCPGGKFYDNGGSCVNFETPKCKECPDGKFRAEGAAAGTPCSNWISACPPGQYRAAASSLEPGACQACPSQQYRSDVAVAVGECSSCHDVQCPEGKHLYACGGASAGSCEKCGEGQFSNGGINSTCTPYPTCAAGTHVSKADWDARVLVSGTSECQRCPVDSYRQSGGEAGRGNESQCQPCDRCPDGEVLVGCGPVNNGTCSNVACDDGTYRTSDVKAFKECTRCQPLDCKDGQELVGCGGKNVMSPGECRVCPAGTYRNEGSGPFCRTCQVPQAGFYSFGCGMASEGKERPCPTGTWRGAAANYSAPCVRCGACSPGTHRLGCFLGQRGKCEQCPKGMYSGRHIAWNATCQVCGQCDDAKVRAGCGHAAQGVCRDCDEGRYKLGSACQLCPACGPGLLAVARSCNGTTPTACVSCPAGQYKPDSDADTYNSPCQQCETCSKGKYRAGCGGQSKGRCDECGAGSYSDSEDYAVCKDCKERQCGDGRYLAGCGDAQPGNCLKCPASKYAVQASSGIIECRVCEGCEPGKFMQDCNGGSPGRCEKCGAGQYKRVSALDGPWDAACAICPPGHKCPPGASRPFLCHAGRYALARSASCSACPAGRFGSRAGLASSTCDGPCPAGYMCPVASVSYNESMVFEDHSSGHHGLDGVAFATRRGETPAGAALECKVTSTESGCVEKCNETQACLACTFDTDANCCLFGTATSFSSPQSVTTFIKGFRGRTYGGRLSCASGLDAETVYCPPQTGPGGEMRVRPGFYTVPEHNASRETRQAELPCPPSYFCAAGRRYPCPAGFACKSKASSFMPCGGRDFFCPALAEDRIPVSAGYFSTAPSNLTEYTHSGEIVMSAQHPCLPGSYCIAGRELVCPVGTHQPKRGQAQCDACPAGRFAQEAEHRDPCPFECPLNYYCPVVQGQSSYLECADKQYCPRGSAKARAIPPASFLAKLWLPQANISAQGVFQIAQGMAADAAADFARVYAAANVMRNLGSGIGNAKAAQDVSSVLDRIRARFPALRLWLQGVEAGSASNSSVKLQVYDHILLPCTEGFYCTDGVQMLCPAGSYCPAGSSTPRACGSIDRFCPTGSSAPKVTTNGFYTTPEGGSARNRTAQEPCNGAQWFCINGERRSVRKGYFSLQHNLEVTRSTVCALGIATLRASERLCPEGFFCSGGVLFRCRAGYLCPPGAEREQNCTEASSSDGPGEADAVFCRGGVRYYTEAGYLTVGRGLSGDADVPTHGCCTNTTESCAPGSVDKTYLDCANGVLGSDRSNCDEGNCLTLAADTPRHNVSALRGHSAVKCCEEGHYCTNGLMFMCAQNSFLGADGAVNDSAVATDRISSSPASFWCPGRGAAKPLNVPAGYYSTPARTHSRTAKESPSQWAMQTGLLPCGCDEVRTPLNASATTVRCGNSLFYCSRGLRFDIGDGFYGIWDNAGAGGSSSGGGKTSSGGGGGGGGNTSFAVVQAGGRGVEQLQVSAFLRNAFGTNVDLSSEVVVQRERCSPYAICSDGAEIPCKIGHACQNNSESTCCSLAPDTDVAAPASNRGMCGLASITSGMCIQCDADKYAFNIWGRVSRCQVCPPRGVTCSGGSIAIMKNWWFELVPGEGLPKLGLLVNQTTALVANASAPVPLHINSETEFYRCTIKDACQRRHWVDGLGIEHHYVECKDGYTAPLCSECAPGWGRSIGNKCIKCPKQNFIWAGFLLLSVMLTIVVVIVVRATGDYRDEKGAGGGRSVVATIKIFINYLFMLSLLRTLAVEWPPSLRNLFKSAKTMSGGAISLADCFKLEYWSIVRFYFFMLPSFCFVVPLLVITLIVVWKILSGAAVTIGTAEIFDMNPRTIYRNTVLVLSYVAWPAVARQAFEVMHCTTINDRNYLSADMRISCDTSTYASYRAWAITILAFFIPLFPAGVFTLLYRNQRKIRKGEHSQHMTAEFRNKFRFLFEGLHKDYPYWELFVMTRKLIFTGTLTLLAHQRWLQLPACLCVMAAIFGLHAAASPYKNWWKGALETVALFALMLSLLLGCALTPLTKLELDARSPGSTDSASALFIAVHIPVLMLFGVLLVAELRHVSQETIERFATCGSAGARARARMRGWGLLSSANSGSRATGAEVTVQDDFSAFSFSQRDITTTSQKLATNPLHRVKTSLAVKEFALGDGEPSSGFTGSNPMFSHHDIKL